MRSYMHAFALMHAIANNTAGRPSSRDRSAGFSSQLVNCDRSRGGGGGGHMHDIESIDKDGRRSVGDGNHSCDLGHYQSDALPFPLRSHTSCPAVLAAWPAGCASSATHSDMYSHLICLFLFVLVSSGRRRVEL